MDAALPAFYYGFAEGRRVGLPFFRVEETAVFIGVAHECPQTHKQQNLALDFSVDISRKQLVVLRESAL